MGMFKSDRVMNLSRFNFCTTVVGVHVVAGLRTTVVSEYGSRVCLKVWLMPDSEFEEIDALCMPYEYTVALEAGLYPDSETVRV
jgi:hypothetical protein